VSGTAVQVHLGATTDDGIALGMVALVERGVGLRPSLVREARGVVELRFPDTDPLRVAFTGAGVEVSDGGEGEPDVVIAGRLPDVLRLLGTPMVAGMPNPIARDGRAALARIADGRVQISGDRALARRLLALLKR
jgi:ubiquinone biosynthesis protein UbiJ